MTKGASACRLAALAALLIGCRGGESPAEPDATPPSERFGPPEAGMYDPVGEGARIYADAQRAGGRGDAGAADAGGADRSCFRGSIVGTLCAPNGETPIVGARVAAQTRDCRGEAAVAEATTDAAGSFTIRQVAPGPTRVVAQTGSHLIQTDVEVPIDGPGYVGGTTGKICFRAAETPVAVLTGAFDRVERVLAALGFDYDAFCGTYLDAAPARRLLQDPARLNSYRVLFVNCGSGLFLRSDDPYTRAEIANLRAFVAQGGSLYVSDLSSDFIEQLWPDALGLRFSPPPDDPATLPACCQCGRDCPAECPLPADLTTCGTDRDLSSLCRATRLSVLGDGPQDRVLATLESRYLQEAMGATEVPIAFDLAGWMRLDDVGPGVEVLVTGQERGGGAPRPLMVLFQPEAGGGRVAYTSFHSSAQEDATVEALISALVLRL